jgi:hypothetical protein
MEGADFLVHLHPNASILAHVTAEFKVLRPKYWALGSLAADSRSADLFDVESLHCVKPKDEGARVVFGQFYIIS